MTHSLRGCLRDLFYGLEQGSMTFLEFESQYLELARYVTTILLTEYDPDLEFYED